ncbi:MAG TPA: dihydropteroate synthase [Chitinophagaceae bacterium]
MFSINCRGRLLSFEVPVVMGIINTTPDSFYGGSRHKGIHDILKTTETMLTDGASIIDIGGQSTRPGSERISADQELNRVIPAIENITREFPEAIISIDSYYSSVVTEAIAAGASIVNDVSAGTMDEALIPTVASLGVPYVLMHMQGAPQTMQSNPTYKNVSLEVFDHLNIKLAALQKAGIMDIIIDPGFGFGKTISHNFQLLHHLSFFSQLERPLMVGLSRKATVYKSLSITPDQALNGTTVMHTIALLNGANILRVHDVKEAMEAIKLISLYKEAGTVQ